jgi:hypothetical protein
LVEVCGWLFAQGIQEPGLLSCGCVFEALLPGVHRRGEPVLEFDQLADLPLQSFDLLRGKSRYALAWSSACIPFPEYSGELSKAEARFDRTADGLYAGDCAWVV